MLAICYLSSLVIKLCISHLHVIKAMLVSHLLLAMHIIKLCISRLHVIKLCMLAICY